MEIQEFRKELLEEIRATADSENDSKANTFIKILCNNLIDLDVLTDYEPCFIKAEGKNRRALRMDAYAFDSLDKSMTVITAIYNDDDDVKVLAKPEAKKTFDRAEYLLEEIILNKLKNKYDISSPQYDFIEQFYRVNTEIRRIRIILITDSIMSKSISKFDNGIINQIPVEYSIWDISRFFKVMGSTDGRETLEIDFKKYSQNGIPLLPANYTVNQCKSYLGIMPANLLADIYDKYGSKLLEGNVRSFLSVKGSVNKKIRQSILTEPKMFFAYNNGIAATATNIELEQREEGLYLIKAEDFQIVNGGQTTASLSTARFKDKAGLDEIFIQMKLTEVEGEEAEKIIPAISRCSNSQNKVSEADFFSTSQFHVRMEQLSRRIYAPAVGGNQYDTHWFYERARGQYTQEQLKMTVAEKKKFTNQNPKSQLITKTDLAKYANSWSGLPHIVSKGAQTNFIVFANIIDPKWEKNNEIFNEKYFKDVVSLAILFKHVERLVSSQDWYQNAYRANIVTYSIALFANKLKDKYKKYEFDFSKIWNRQEVPYEVTKEFIGITKKVFEDITAPGRSTMNVTQWCKREACWESIQKIDITFDGNIEKLLINRHESMKVICEFKKEQKVINEIEYQTKVVTLGEQYWNNVLRFGKEKGLIGLEEEKILNLVVQMRSSKLPNHIQCKYLLQLVDRLKEEGFVS